MATLYIAEFKGLRSAARALQAVAAPPVAEQIVAIGAEAKSAAFNADTRVVRLHADSVCSILIGSSPTAATTNARLAANQTEYFGVNPGDKVSVIANT